MTNHSIVILNRVRLTAIFGQLILLVCSIAFFDIKLPNMQLLAILTPEIVFALYANKVSLVRKISQNEMLFHILFDSTILAGIIYFSGGANNPFIYLLLLYIAIASFMLQRKRLIVLVCIELVLYSLLNIYQYPVELGESSPLASFHLHLVGMWVNFILTAILLAIFGLITRKSLLGQEKKLQELREKDLQDEQILGLGIMSANAAHELGTPLSIMAIVIDDIQHADIAETYQQDMKLLQAQIIRCRNIIGRLNDKSQHAQQQLSTQVDDQHNLQGNNFKKQLELLIDRWLVYQPKMSIIRDLEEIPETTQYQISISLEQAITNLLDNAADASLDNKSNKIQMKNYQSDNNIIIEIIDNGIGISKQQNLKIGRRIQPSKKQDGLGWGIFLSNVSIERVGGNVRILDYEDKLNNGSLTQIILPKGHFNTNDSF